MLNDAARLALEAYSRGEISSLDARRRLDDASFGDVLRMLSEAELPLPRAPVAGREDRIDRARRWMFPASVA